METSKTLSQTFSWFELLSQAFCHSAAELTEALVQRACSPLNHAFLLYIPIIPALRELRQKYCCELEASLLHSEFTDSLNSIARPVSKIRSNLKWFLYRKISLCNGSSLTLDSVFINCYPNSCTYGVLSESVLIIESCLTLQSQLCASLAMLFTGHTGLWSFV